MPDSFTEFPRTRDVLEEGRLSGLHPGAQIYVSLRGRPLLDAALGEARPGHPMRSDTPTLWMSSGKPLTAIAIAELIDQGRISLDTHVVEWIPGFDKGGKGSITVRHLLTHTAGFRSADPLPGNLPWDETIRRVREAPLEPGWEPGHKAGYQLASSWFILGEIVQRIVGRPLSDHLREAIMLPAGMADSWVGMPAERYHDYGARIAWMFQTGAGESSPLSTHNSEEAVTACRPGSNGRGPVRELGRFYEHLLKARQPEGQPCWRVTSATLEAFTSRQRIGLFDETFRHVIDWGFGFIIDSNRYGRETVPYGYGPYCSEETFGHGGSQSSSAFADPGNGLVVAWALNGMPGEPKHQKRARAIQKAIYEDLGLDAGNHSDGKPRIDTNSHE
ncbi:MAG TPA: serine hydrolase domain-containing protein [Methylomirabilota bacterium]|nr:serine hydrolase domain-containing protein [Methylomirabilota bacterium]